MHILRKLRDSFTSGADKAANFQIICQAIEHFNRLEETDYKVSEICKVYTVFGGECGMFTTDGNRIPSPLGTEKTIEALGLTRIKRSVAIDDRDRLIGVNPEHIRVVMQDGCFFLASRSDDFSLEAKIVPDKRVRNLFQMKRVVENDSTVSLVMS